MSAKSRGLDSAAVGAYALCQLAGLLLADDTRWR